MDGKFDLSGRVAVVTGGAGWVGLAICQSLGIAGAAVVIASRNIKQAHAAAESLVSHGIMASSVQMDVTIEDSVTSAYEGVMEKYGKIDILVNNAGTATNLMVEALSIEEWNRVMAVNVTGTFICSKVFSRPMIEAGGGSIVNVSSIYGVVAPDQRIYGDSGLNSSLAYGASKAAIIQMTRYLAVYWADKGLRINCVSPGGVQRDHKPDFLTRYSTRVPMGRMAQQDELGGAVVFLASDASAYVTGQNLMLDGGLTAW